MSISYHVINVDLVVVVVVVVAPRAFNVIHTYKWALESGHVVVVFAPLLFLGL